MKNFWSFIAAVLLLCGCATRRAETLPSSDANLGATPEPVLNNETNTIADAPAVQPEAAAAPVVAAPEIPKKALTPQERYVADNPNLKSEVRAAILKGDVLVGMSMGDVRTAWGAPHREKKSQDEVGSCDFWIYGNTALLFREGLLQSLSRAR